jgi:4-amino-4-deoxy-L-arabinose transferase-like glycosyltransferase
MAYAFGLLSIGLTSDWHLIHEDNGALHTTLALSHMKLGLRATRAHDVFFNPHTGEALVYGHHPPLTALVLAGVFTLTGSDSPAVARMVPIAFHLGSICIMVFILSKFLSRGKALFGGFLMATIPMSAYFGRMVNYEPLCLFAIVVELAGYVVFKRTGSKRGLVWLCFGIVLGGLIDWGSFFFAAAIAGLEAVDMLRRRAYSGTLLVASATAAAAVFAFDIWHFSYAADGSLAAFREAFSHGPRTFTVMKFLGGQIDIFRRYYTHAGLVSVLIVVLSIVRPRLGISKGVFGVPGAGLVKNLLVVTGAAAGAYVVVTPTWAKIHMYWQFYFLPFVVVSMTLVWWSLWRKIARTRSRAFTALAVIFIVEVVATSAYMLHFRHTRPGSYAIEKTAELRATYLAPRHTKEN